MLLMRPHGAFARLRSEQHDIPFPDLDSSRRLREGRNALLENGETMLLSGLQAFSANICRKQDVAASVQEVTAIILHHLPRALVQAESQVYRQR